jgi:hypothetical protein
MKKTLILLLTLVAFALMPESASAQIDLTKALGGLLGAAQSSASSSSSNSPYKKLAEAAPAASTLMGNWTYDSATFAYVGNNPLAGAVVAQLDPVAADVLRQIGVSQGSATLTLDKSRGSVTHGDMVLKGEYEYNSSTAGITISGVIEKVAVSVKGYVKYSAPMLTVMLDVKELVEAVKSIYPEYKSDPNVILIESLLKDMGDVFVVGKFKRQ